jgi:hypothetical protein
VNGDVASADPAAIAEQLALATEQALLAAVDAGAVGLVEMAVAARIASDVRGGHRLNIEQARTAWRILDRNEARCARAGITVPRPTAPLPPPVAVSSGPAGSPTLGLRSDGRMVIEGSPFALNEALKQEAHVVWDRARRHWHAPATPASVAAVVTVLGAFQPRLSPRIAALAEEFRRWGEYRELLHPDAPVPRWDTSHLNTALLKGGELWVHQLRAVEYAVRCSAALLAVPMGGGKTLAALAVAQRTDARRVIIGCPNKVRGVWPREITKWTRLRWHVVDGRRPVRGRSGRMKDLSVAERVDQLERNLFDCPCGAVHAAVINYEMLTHQALAHWVPPDRIDLVIWDEIQALKGTTSQVSLRAARWVDFSDRRLGLTGTPMPQYPWDIFGIYRALDPGIFGPYWTPFKERYVIEKARKDMPEQSFPVAIDPEMRREFVTKAHSIMYAPVIDLGLPGARHIVRPVALEPAARAEYARLESEEMFADLTDFAPEDVDEALLTPANVLARTTRLRQFTGGTVPDDGEMVTTPTGKRKRVRELYRVSQAKGAELAQIFSEVGCVADRAGGPEPVVVYTSFIADLDVVREEAEKAGLRYREISGRRRDGLTEQATMAEGADVLGVQVDSGGTGIDLTRSCYGVWYSTTYKAGVFSQAIKRQDRPGQRRVVTFIHLVATDTIDTTVYRSLISRRSTAATYLATRGITPAMIGLEDSDVAPEMDLDEMQGRLNADRESQPDDGQRSNRVRLLIDEFGADVAAGLASKRGPRQPAVTDEQLREFDLEGFI